jgi:hypothetical protein
LDGLTSTTISLGRHRTFATRQPFKLRGEPGGTISHLAALREGAQPPVTRHPDRAISRTGSSFRSWRSRSTATSRPPSCLEKLRPDGTLHYFEKPRSNRPSRNELQQKDPDAVVFGTDAR